MPVYDSIVSAIGHTPLVRVRRIGDGSTASILLKLEYLNPGGSVKDRAARSMIEAAEASGQLQPGGTIVEGTSGNTGIGLAQAAAQRGYRVVAVVPDKVSAEKLDILRAYGAEVVITGSGLPREHPEHVSSIAERLSQEIPGAWLADQYDNPANPAAHYSTTGPEIWADTQGRVTHFVAGIGTGGTITGTGECLKQVSGSKRWWSWCRIRAGPTCPSTIPPAGYGSVGFWTTIVRMSSVSPDGRSAPVTVTSGTPVGRAWDILRGDGYQQQFLPVVLDRAETRWPTAGSEILGSIGPRSLASAAARDPGAAVGEIADPPPAAIGAERPSTRRSPDSKGSGPATSSCCVTVGWPG